MKNILGLSHHIWVWHHTLNFSLQSKINSMNVITDFFSNSVHFHELMSGKKISKFWDWHTSGMGFRTKLGPKNSPILTKIGIHIDQTSDYYHAKFYQNRTTLRQLNHRLKLSDFNKILRGNSQKFGLYVYQFSSKSDHFSALFCSWIGRLGGGRSPKFDRMLQINSNWNGTKDIEFGIYTQNLVFLSKFKNRVCSHAY